MTNKLLELGTRPVIMNRLTHWFLSFLFKSMALSRSMKIIFWLKEWTSDFISEADLDLVSEETLGSMVENMFENVNKSCYYSHALLCSCSFFFQNVWANVYISFLNRNWTHWLLGQLNVARTFFFFFLVTLDTITIVSNFLPNLLEYLFFGCLIKTMNCHSVRSPWHPNVQEQVLCSPAGFSIGNGINY